MANTHIYLNSNHPMKEIICIITELIILAFPVCTEGYSQYSSRLNALQTTVPFLTLVTNARAGAFGEISVVSSSFYKYAGLIQNPALLSGKSKHVGGNSSYMPWLGNLAADIYVMENNHFYSFNKQNARSEVELSG
jgi:hypothetical protein